MLDKKACLPLDVELVRQEDTSSCRTGGHLFLPNKKTSSGGVDPLASPGCGMGGGPPPPPLRWQWSVKGVGRGAPLPRGTGCAGGGLPLPRRLLYSACAVFVSTHMQPCRCSKPLKVASRTRSSTSIAWNGLRSVCMHFSTSLLTMLGEV